jgi:uncharacterized phage protein (TIGR01671 family)
MAEFRGKVIQRVSRFPDKYHDFGFVYGWHYCHYNGDFSSMIVEESKDFEEFKTYDVVHHTVSQFIGLKDKTGKKMFVHDIFRFTKHPKYLMDSFIAEVIWNEGKAYFGYKVLQSKREQFPVPFSRHDELQNDFLNHVEIIGNRFDTPELLP